MGVVAGTPSIFEHGVHALTEVGRPAQSSHTDNHESGEGVENVDATPAPTRVRIRRDNEDAGPIQNDYSTNGDSSSSKGRPNTYYTLGVVSMLKDNHQGKKNKPTNSYQQGSQSGGYDTGNQNGYNTGNTQGGYNTGNMQGGYNSGKQNGNTQGGYNTGNTQGGYNTGNMQGGYNSGKNQGGYNTGNNQGGYNTGKQQDNGYNQGGNIGYQQGENTGSGYGNTGSGYGNTGNSYGQMSGGSTDNGYTKNSYMDLLGTSSKQGSGDGSQFVLFVH